MSDPFPKTLAEIGKVRPVPEEVLRQAQALLAEPVGLTRIWVPPYIRVNEHGHLEDVSGYWRDIDSVEDLTPSERIAFDTRARVLAKIAEAPIPTAAQVADIRRKYRELGADRVEANMRGNNKDRARSRRNLVFEFSFDGGETCPCVYCGVLLTVDTVTRDRIIPGSEGGRYILLNLVPACLACNKARVDKPISEVLR